MATYVIGSIAKFIEEGDIDFEGTTFVVPTLDDIWYLKSIFSKHSIDLMAMRFLTACELREKLMEIFNVEAKLCSSGLVDLFFDEIANEMPSSDCLGNVIAEGKLSTLQAFGEVSRLGEKAEGFISPKLCSFFGALRRKIAENNFICESDADRLLLKLAANKFTDWKIIFYGFQPFDEAKVLMEAAAKCCRRADIITYDFGDAEFIHLWLRTLEQIFGECKFYLDYDAVDYSPFAVNFIVFETAIDEVNAAMDEILKILSADSSARIAICIGDMQSIYLPMFLDKLELHGVAHCDNVGRCGNYAANYRIIISLWGDWQTRRDISSFCRFCTELLANDLIDRTAFDAIITILPGLQGKCISENYDVLLEFANLKNVHSFDVAEKYDIHGSRFQFKDFCKRFTAAFADVLPEELLEALGEQLNYANAEKFFPRKSLVKYFSRFVRLGGKNYAINMHGNVILIGANSAYKQDFTHIFAVGMSAKHFDPAENNYWLSGDVGERINRNVTEEVAGEHTICSAQNLCLTHGYRQYLQNVIFGTFGRRSSLVLSFSTRDISGDAAQVDPAKIFREMLRVSQGEFYTAEVARKLLLRPANELSLGALAGEADGKSIRDCADSYAVRHDLDRNLHDYCFAIDKKSAGKISCKSLEYLLKNPHMGFYDSVLKLSTMPWQSKASSKKISLGSLAHEFLQIFEAGRNFMPKISQDIFHGNIDARAQRLKVMVARACAAADAPIPSDFIGTVNSSIVAAKRLVQRLFALPDWESFCSEYSLPGDLSVRIGSEELKLSGRLDFLTSVGTGKEANLFSYAATVIDFKTGNDLELTPKNVRWHMQRYSSLQLFLYGLALREIGFQDVKILILKPDSGISSTAIAMEYIVEQVPELISKLEQFIETGLIERQILGKTFAQYFLQAVPLATTDLY
ncbi:MAG: PD-(D/E)XK nuclease family protein [Puniceicoccales bacterium]|jgi:hypothetical protein|nr:PD-(D/E)XK nuclease family protein [Puniceicoccales bacterium]